MSLPPWYRPKRRPLAEAVLSVDLSRATGIGPLVPGLSVRWDMTPLLCLSDPSYRVGLTVDAEGRTLNISRRRKPIATLWLQRDTRRFGEPIRAVCPRCSRLTHRLYLYNGWFQCGKCLNVTYASGQRGVSDRANARMQRLEHRLYCTQWLPRYRGRRKIQAEMVRQDMRWFGCLPVRLLRGLMDFQ